MTKYVLVYAKSHDHDVVNLTGLIKARLSHLQPLLAIFEIEGRKLQDKRIFSRKVYHLSTNLFRRKYVIQDVTYCKSIFGERREREGRNSALHGASRCIRKFWLPAEEDRWYLSRTGSRQLWSVLERYFLIRTKYIVLTVINDHDDVHTALFSHRKSYLALNRFFLCLINFCVEIIFQIEYNFQ